MRRCRILCGWLIIAVLAGSLIGCGTTEEVVLETMEEASVYTGPASMETTPVIDYEIPESKPNILVNRVGYSTESIKEAVIVGDNLPAQFSVIEAGTEEVVFHGIIDQFAFDEDRQLYMGKAVFDDLVEPGDYYVKCEILGESYPFTIQEKLYQQLFLEVYEEMLKDCGNNALELSDITALLTAYECYPQIFPDEDDSKVPDILEALEAWFSLEERTLEEKKNCLYVAALAKFGYLYQEVNMQQASGWIQQAANLFVGIQKSEENEPDYFYALTELYRATGWNTYRYQIIEYTDFFDGNSVYLGETSYLYGAMTYMVTKQRVSVPLCNIFYGDIEDKGDNIADLYEYMINPMESPENNTEGVFSGMQQLFCCNYLLNNYEYMHIIEEFLNFCMGQNVASVSLYPWEGEKSTYMLLLAQLAAENLDEG